MPAVNLQLLLGCEHVRIFRELCIYNIVAYQIFTISIWCKELFNAGGLYRTVVVVEMAVNGTLEHPVNTLMVCGSQLIFLKSIGLWSPRLSFESVRNAMNRESAWIGPLILNSLTWRFVSLILPLEPSIVRVLYVSAATQSPYSSRYFPSLLRNGYVDGEVSVIV